jgi:hypothetical protein
MSEAVACTPVLREGWRLGPVSPRRWRCQLEARRTLLAATSPGDHAAAQPKRGRVDAISVVEQCPSATKLTDCDNLSTAPRPAAVAARTVERLLRPTLARHPSSGAIGQSHDRSDDRVQPGITKERRSIELKDRVALIASERRLYEDVGLAVGVRFVGWIAVVLCGGHKRPSHRKSRRPIETHVEGAKFASRSQTGDRFPGVLAAGNAKRADLVALPHKPPAGGVASGSRIGLRTDVADSEPDADADSKHGNGPSAFHLAQQLRVPAEGCLAT